MIEPNGTVWTLGVWCDCPTCFCAGTFFAAADYQGDSPDECRQKAIAAGWDLSGDMVLCPPCSEDRRKGNSQ